MTRFRVGVDIGGTFTDIVFLGENGQRLTRKISSTVDNYATAIVDGLAELISERNLEPTDIVELLHGTTVSTNIVLEAKGAKVGLLVTENFEQVLHLARSQTPGPLAGWIIMQKPDPLADLEATRGIS